MVMATTINTGSPLSCSEVYKFQEGLSVPWKQGICKGVAGLNAFCRCSCGLAYGFESNAKQLVNADCPTMRTSDGPQPGLKCDEAILPSPNPFEREINIFAQKIIDNILRETWNSFSTAGALKIVSDGTDPNVEEVIYLMEHYKSPSGSNISFSHGTSTKVGLCSLPEEILLKIFSYLPQAELFHNVCKVCKQWSNLCKDPSLWKCIDFNKMHEDLKTMKESAEVGCDAFPVMITVDVFKVLLTVFQNHIWALKMSRFVGDCVLKDTTMLYLCRCTNISTLDLGFSDNVDLKTICRQCRTIQTLILEGCRTLQDSDFSEINLLHNLHKLDVSYCAMLTNTFLTCLYDLRSLRSLTTDGVMHLTDYGLISFFHKQTLMEELIIDGEDLSDEPVCFAAENLPHLVVFELSFSQCLTSRSIFAFKDLHRMKSLRFRKASNITGSSICQVFSPALTFSLRTFAITECEDMNDEALISLSCCCPFLESLTLDWCWKISDQGLQNVVNNCKKIKTLSLIGLFGIEGKNWLDSLEERLPDLTLMDLSDCNQMPDEQLMNLFCRKPTLSIYTYFHDKICLPDSAPLSSSSSEEEICNEWRCPGEVGAKVDF